MEHRVNKLLQSKALSSFVKIMEEESSILIENLWESPKAALVCLLAKAVKKNVLLISSGQKESSLLDDLEYFGLKETLLEFPAWETLPGEEILPSPDIVGRRFLVLHELLESKDKRVVLAPLQACLQKITPKKKLKALCKTWKKGDTIPFHALKEMLTQLGYKQVPIVADKGEFALRGGILDIFPLSSTDPFRCDFFGDTLEAVRIFDPVGQKSISKVDTLFIPPANEMELLKEDKELNDLLDYFSEDTLVIFDDLLAIEDRYVEWQKMPAFNSRFFFSFEAFFKKMKPYSRLYWTKERTEELSSVQIKKRTGSAYYSGKDPLQPLTFQMLNVELETKRFAHPFAEVQEFLSPLENKTAATQEEIFLGITRYAANLDLHLICATEAEEKHLKERIQGMAFPEKTLFERGYLSSAFSVIDSGLTLLPMTEFTHRYKVRRQKWRSTYHTPPSEFHALSYGDIVVHFHQGIGKYLGIEKKPNHLGIETEFMIIEFAESSKLYVPVAQSYLISRYIGSKEEIPLLSTIGGQRWQKAKIQAQKAIIGYANDLLRLNAEREIKGGFVYAEDSEEMAQFEEAFPFAETEDQIRAIQDIKNDMTSKKAMDRLICGDVGYGKTEVAMRAAFKAVADGKKQVAVLVPTTILAMQHFESFRDRMAHFAINVDVISRFRSPKEVRETLAKVAAGEIDILVGTHRLISKDVHFKDLGLIIIDEEQRFGVRAKEHLKALKVGVDCITLSATPIPRTLYMSLIGAKEISVINTPPQDRLPIKSIIAEKNPVTVQNALLRELSREGQAYFIHNRVESIFKVAEELQKLLPQARIVVGHGQMSANELDIVFHAFKTGEADVLVATTLIENGIDIPNANTILIDRSETFGLADLYQMRGRVGRWNRPAYAYFLIPPQKVLPEIARKRLFALVESSGYGGGMKIAMRDLEIRGAGDILGTEQSGQISTIGFHLYCKLLKRTIDALQKKAVPSFTETKIEFPYDARLPEEYVAESSLRLEIYHRLGEASTFEEVEEILAELKDRFGPIPPEVVWLYHLTRLRIFVMQQKIVFLKIEKYTFTVEWQKGKTSSKKTFPLPKFKKPEELEKTLCTILSSQ